MDNNEIYSRKIDNIRDSLMDINWKLSNLQYKLQENDKKDKTDFFIILIINIVILASAFYILN